MNHAPKAGDTVYSADGAMAIFVAPAKGGGYIVQPLLEDGDGVTEPESHYVDGVDHWTGVYREPPRPMLDKDIAEQVERLAALRREVVELERQKREAERDGAALRDRLGVHQALSVLDDLLAGRCTHYVVDVSDNGSQNWELVPAAEFFKLRTHYSIAQLRLWTSFNGNRATVQWKFSPNTDGREKERDAYAFTNEADARAKLVDLVTSAITETARHASNSYWLRQRIGWCRKQGVEPPADAIDKLDKLERAEAAAAIDKARTELAQAEARLSQLQPSAA